MATFSQLRRRVALGGIPVIEMRSLLAKMSPYDLIKIHCQVWAEGTEGQWLTFDGSRVPFEITCAGDEAVISIFAEAHEDACFREQVRRGLWKADGEDLSPAEPSLEDPVAKEQALRDFEEDRLRQERRERLMSSRKRGRFLAEKDSNQ